MAPKQQRTLYVIFASPQQFHQRNRYIADDGTVTDRKEKAAKFDSFDAAEAFTQSKGIALSERTYIGIEQFSEFEL
jgi:hypothetical protein